MNSGKAASVASFLEENVIYGCRVKRHRDGVAHAVVGACFAAGVEFLEIAALAEKIIQEKGALLLAIVDDGPPWSSQTTGGRHLGRGPCIRVDAWGARLRRAHPDEKVQCHDQIHDDDGFYGGGNEACANESYSEEIMSNRKVKKCNASHSLCSPSQCEICMRVSMALLGDYSPVRMTETIITFDRRRDCVS